MELALMVGAAALGFAGGSIWFPLIIGVLLTVLSCAKLGTLARRYADVGSARIVALSLSATTVNNVAFAFMAFVAGRAFAWLVSL
jgi:hypothetical protein